uniref:Uncharacterized protein n=1 Tax=Acrobeloides nanus TaxID=290746 RepID=A0A914D0X0_9BILA
MSAHGGSTTLSTTTVESATKNNQGMSALHQLSCKFSVLWLIWAILQIIAINLMFYGIKNNKWLLFMPHIFLRACCALIIVGLVVLLIISFINYIQNGSGIRGAILAFILVGLGILIFWIYIIKCQVRCCQFVKKSAETGFSVSNIRPVGAHTLSMSEPRALARPPSAQAVAPPGTVAMNMTVADGMGRVNSGDGRPLPNARELPPLRHTYRPS